MRHLALAFAVSGLMFSLTGCSDSTTTPAVDSGTAATGDSSTPKSDAAAATDSATPVADTGTTPAALKCTDAEFAANDKSAIPGQIQIFPTTAAPAQYKQPCLTIKVGQTVEFQGDFSLHPLEATGGDKPSPIPALTDTGMSLKLTFPTAGSYGYDCKKHISSMFGAIKVIP